MFVGLDLPRVVVVVGCDEVVLFMFSGGVFPLELLKLLVLSEKNGIHLPLMIPSLLPRGITFSLRSRKENCRLKEKKNKQQGRCRIYPLSSLVKIMTRSLCLLVTIQKLSVCVAYLSTCK